MKTKNLLKLFFVGGIAALAVVSCAKKEQAVKGYNVADFAVEVPSTTATTATAKVTVNNNDESPWYAFATTDLESKAADLVAATVEDLAVSTKILNTGSKEIELGGLIPGGVHYRVIVTGLAPDGRTYGTPAEASFRTGMGYGINENWAVEYYGTSIEEGEEVNYFEISGTAEDDSFSYIVVPAETFAEMGGAEEVICADVEAILAAGAAADATFSGDDYYTWDALEPGDYVFVMYGVDKSFNPTMEYTSLEFTVEAASDLYSAFLGNWFTEEGDMVTIEPETINQTFYVNGLLASFDPSGAIVFGVYGLGGGIYTVGVDEKGGAVYTVDVIGYGQLSEDGSTLQLNPGAENIVGITAMGFTGSSFVPVGASVIPVPLTLSNQAPQPTEEYSAWIGTWYTDGGDVFEIKAGVVNNTLLMSGFLPEMDIKLSFDKETGDVNIFYHAVGKDKDGTYYLTGKDQENYLEDAEQAPVSGLLATAKMADDGESFDVTGNRFDAVYGSTTYDEIISKLGIYISVGDSWYGLENAIELTLPATLYNKIPEPSEEYLAWVGNWTVVRGTGASATEDTWTIAEKKVNSEYTVTGIEGTSFKVEGSFDKATGAFSIPEQTVYEVSDENGDAIMSIELMGTIVYQRQTLPLGVGAIPFSAVLDESGNVTVSAEYYAGYYKFNGFRLFGLMLASDSVAAYSEVGYSIPFTMTAAEEEEETTALSFPINPEQWTAAGVQRFGGAKGISTQSADKGQVKTKAGKTLSKEKKFVEYPGASTPQSKAGSKKANFGGGKRGKLNK